MQENRQFFRHPSSIPVEVRQLGGRDDLVSMSDISLGGLSFRFQWPIAVGVCVELRVPSLAEHISLAGFVVRCEGGGAQWIIGIAFENMKEVFRMRMVQQICQIENYRRTVLERDGRALNSDEAAAEWIACNATHFPRCGI